MPVGTKLIVLLHIVLALWSRAAHANPAEERAARTKNDVYDWISGIFGDYESDESDSKEYLICRNCTVIVGQANATGGPATVAPTPAPPAAVAPIPAAAGAAPAGGVAPAPSAAQTPPQAPATAPAAAPAPAPAPAPVPAAAPAPASAPAPAPDTAAAPAPDTAAAPAPAPTDG
ncbi:cyclin-dependent kinase inhibitor 1C [Drosophila novamexicana]|uniref:cyclin-dependent kinase inhibitor 1C n=1 Tax=Drosophila novamexicana TaxID=47314 RepID=UPI0011E59F73|nr:cyclin-dependent kinase inhibitor 1C [Drosophila novamexicana]